MDGFEPLKIPEVTFRILRFKPGRIDPPKYVDFPVQLAPHMTVLDGLDQVRRDQAPGLMYRHCCHHASCGTCACIINDTASLACMTRVADLGEGPIKLAPLTNYPCMGDLAVDMRAFYKKMDDRWANIRLCENATAERLPQGVGQLMRLESCIECGCCVAACPVSRSSREFFGPAVLAAINNEMRNRPYRGEKLLQTAADQRGAPMCRRHLDCSRACPSQVYPARHIADLLRAIDDEKK